jgi:hypothetical protein
MAAFDPRWVRCRRPVIIAGGELTLDTLDLKLDPISRDYEAPLQVKATGGVFVIDDFGRQLVRPQDLLNRWIIPLERKIDYLTLHTGKKFSVPFDELVIFSTNLSPEDLMDTAFLRRLSYKFLVGPPSVEHYRTLFRRVCTLRGVESAPDEILSYLFDVFYQESGEEIAATTRTIIDHVLALQLRRRPCSFPLQSKRCTPQSVGFRFPDCRDRVIRDGDTAGSLDSLSQPSPCFGAETARGTAVSCPYKSHLGRSRTSLYDRYCGAAQVRFH